MARESFDTKFLLGNVNHCRSAQDLLSQAMAEWSINIAVVTEPYYVPSHWLSDLNGVVTVIRQPSTDSPPLSLVEQGPGYVAVIWGDTAIVGVYFSPNRPISEFETLLTALSTVVGRLAPRQILVAGDFNAKAVSWGNPATKCNLRGQLLEDWAVSSGLCLLNRGSTFTCVRAQGGSVVDVSFATPSLAGRVNNWRVDLGENLSDHRFIRWEISPTIDLLTSPRPGRPHFPRWSITRLDKTLAREAALVQSWISIPFRGLNVDASALNLRESLTGICDSSMPRSRRPPPRRACYWWSEELANLRAACIAAQRAYTCSRRRANRDVENEARLHDLHMEAKKRLKVAIGDAKNRAKEEMLESPNNDPWGRPYRAARNKLRPIGPPLTETLEPSLLDEVVQALFPVKSTSYTPPSMGSRLQSDSPGPLVTAEELDSTALCLRTKKTAPGPDGIPAKIVALATIEFGVKFRELFDECFAVGRFPKPWKEGQLCLLRKEGRPPDSPSAYRPIVLLDEVGKLFERVIAARINAHLRDSGPNLNEAQFGFRAGQSTIDACPILNQTSWSPGAGETVFWQYHLI